MKYNTKPTASVLDHKESASYLKMTCDLLRSCRKSEDTGFGSLNSAKLTQPGVGPRRNQIENLDAWRKNRHATPTDMKEFFQHLSPPPKLGDGGKFCSLLACLDSWLEMHRPGFLEELNGPVKSGELRDLGKSSGLALPCLYSHLIDWHDGQKKNSTAIFNPFSHERFMSFAEGKISMERQNLTLEKCYPAEDLEWSRDWLPFMVDPYGNYTCISLNPEFNGVIIRWWRDGRREFIFSNLNDWLGVLLGRLYNLEFEYEQPYWWPW